MGWLLYVGSFVIGGDEMKMSRVWLVLILVGLIFTGGCAAKGNLAPPGRIVAISLFKCNCDPVVQEAVRDSLVDVFFTYTNAETIKGEIGDITIVGTMTMAEGQSAIAKGKISGGGSSNFSAVGGATSSSSLSGSYASGITIQAYKNGKLIATHSAGQDIGNVALISPVSLAKAAAWYIVKPLAYQNEIGYK